MQRVMGHLKCSLTAGSIGTLVELTGQKKRPGTNCEVTQVGAVPGLWHG